MSIVSTAHLLFLIGHLVSQQPTSSPMDADLLYNTLLPYSSTLQDAYSDSTIERYDDNRTLFATTLKETLDEKKINYRQIDIIQLLAFFDSCSFEPPLEPCTDVFCESDICLNKHHTSSQTKHQKDLKQRAPKLVADMSLAEIKDLFQLIDFLDLQPIPHPELSEDHKKRDEKNTQLIFKAVWKKIRTDYPEAIRDQRYEDLISALRPVIKHRYFLNFDKMRKLSLRKAPLTDQHVEGFLKKIKNEIEHEKLDVNTIKYLDLSYCYLTRLDINKWLKVFPELTIIDASNNFLNSITWPTKSSRLKILKLKNNKFVHFPNIKIQDADFIIDLRNNPLSCATRCKLRPLVSFRFKKALQLGWKWAKHRDKEIAAGLATLVVPFAVHPLLFNSPNPIQGMLTTFGATLATFALAFTLATTTPKKKCHSAYFEFPAICLYGGAFLWTTGIGLTVVSTGAATLGLAIITNHGGSFSELWNNASYVTPFVGGAAASILLGHAYCYSLKQCQKRLKIKAVKTKKPRTIL